MLTADKRAVFRPFVCLCLVVSSCERSRPPVQQQTINGGLGRGGLPLRMTPPWPFSTSPHCASTEPCGDTHSLGQTRWYEIASARFMRCWSAPHPACRATETAGIKGASFHGGDACFVGIQRRFIHHNKPKPGLLAMELSNDAWAYFLLNQHIHIL